MTNSPSTDGLEQTFVTRGDASGVPLVLLHGFTGHRDDFNGVCDALGKHRRVIVPDLRGHGARGDAADPSEYSFSACVSDLVALLDGLGIERCDLLGHSMGGMIALRVALEHARRVRSLVLMSTTPRPLSEETAVALLRAVAFLERSDLVSMQAAMEKVGRAEPDPVIASWADRYWSHQRRRYAEMDPAAYVGFARAMIEPVSLTEDLGKVRCPVLVLVGSEDADFLPGADLLEAGIPGAERLTLEGAGHHPHEERREDFLRAMDQHLGSVGTGDDRPA